MKNLKTFESFNEGLSSMEWRKTFKVGDKVKMTGNFSDKEAEGTIKELTNDDIILDNGKHYGSVSWSAEKIDGEHVDEFLGGLKDKLAGIQKFVLDKFKPSGEAQEFVNRDTGTYRKALEKMKVPGTLLKNAIMALYDFADGVPYLDRIEMKYDDATKTLELHTKKKGNLFSGDPVLG